MAHLFGDGHGSVDSAASANASLASQQSILQQHSAPRQAEPVHSAAASVNASQPMAPALPEPTSAAVTAAAPGHASQPLELHIHIHIHTDGREVMVRTSSSSTTTNTT